MKIQVFDPPMCCPSGDGAVVCKGKYPTREALSGYAGLAARPTSDEAPPEQKSGKTSCC